MSQVKASEFEQGHCSCRLLVQLAYPQDTLHHEKSGNSGDRARQDRNIGIATACRLHDNFTTICDCRAICRWYAVNDQVWKQQLKWNQHDTYIAHGHLVTLSPVKCQSLRRHITPSMMLVHVAIVNLELLHCCCNVHIL